MGMIRSLAFAVLAAGCAANAFAQVQTGELTGFVKSPDGQTVPGATVTLKGAALQGTRTSVSDQNGAFAVHALPPGSYDVTVELSGMATKRERVTVDVGRTSVLNTTLAPAGVSETVNVTADVGSATMPATEVGATYKASTINALPTSRTIFGIAELAPGLTNNTPNAGQVTISGGFAYDNRMMINGVDVADSLFGSANPVYIEDAIAETTVLTSGISAEYGRFTGGVINAVTKSGGNAFSGSFRANLSNPTWTALTPLEKTNHITHKSHLGKSYEGTFGGPIMQDRLWFFGAGRWQQSSTTGPLQVSNIPFDTTTKDKRLEVNGTTTVKPGHTLQVHYLDDNASNTRINLGGGIDPHAAANPEFPTNLLVGSYGGVLRSNLLLSAQASIQREGFRKSGGSDPNIVNSPFFAVGLTPNILPGAYYNGAYFDSTDPEDRNNRDFTGSLTWYRSGWAGSHDIKGGFEHFTSIWNGGNSQSASNYVFDSDYLANADGTPVLDANGYFIPVFVPGAFNSDIQHWIATKGATLHTRTLGLYAQDHWTVNPRLSLDLGGRFEAVRTSSSIPGPQGINANNIAPRLAATYDLEGNGRTILQATYAHYAGGYNPIQAGANSSVNNPSETVFYYTGPPGQGRDFVPGFNPANYTIPGVPYLPTINIFMDPALHSPVVHEATASVGRQIGHGTAKLTYTHRRYTGLIEDFIDDPSAAGKIEAVFQGIDYGTVDRHVLRNSNLPARAYDALQLQANYRPMSRLSLEGHWTFQLKDDGTFEGEFGNQPAQESPVGDYPEILSRARNYPTGHLNDYQRHKARLWVIYTQPLGRFGSLDLAPLVAINSGLTYSLAQTNVPLSDIQLERNPGYAELPGGGVQTLYFGDRGSQFFKGYGVLDFSTTYSIPVVRSARPYFKVEAYNVLNDDKQIAWNTTVRRDPDSPLDAFGLPTGYIKSVNFGKPLSNASYVPWRAGSSGGRTFLLSFGARF